MKIVVINISGNVGKTTLTKHLLVPQLPGAKRIAIEDSNQGDGKVDLKIVAQQFGDLAAQLNSADPSKHYVIDVGASTARAMVDHFAKLRRTRAGIDFWVIPATPTQKQVEEALETARELGRMGVPPADVILLPNAVADKHTIQRDFGVLMEAATAGFHVPAKWVMANDVYRKLKDSEDTVFSAFEGGKDLEVKMAAARKAGNKEEITRLGEAMVVADMCEEATQNMRETFASTPIAARLAETAKPARAAAATA
jgi:hypothetical protein